MLRGAKGFQKLKNKYITRVNAKAINVVVVRTADGKIYEIEAVVGGTSLLPYLELTEKKEKKIA